MNNLRKIHIGDDIWKYVIDDQRRWDEPINIRIYDTARKMTRITSKDITGDDYTCQIKPSDIKKYILDKLI